MTISNQGDSDITIIALESAAAGRVAFHQTIVTDDIARMEALDALTVPAGETVELRPGGIHIMLTDLTADLAPASQLHLQLICDKGELYDLEISVQDMLMGELDDAVDIGGLVFSNRWARPARAGAMPEMEDSDMEMSATPVGLTMLTIRQARRDEAAWLQSSFDAHMGWTKPVGYFQSAIDLQESGEVALLVARWGRAYVGHCKVAWRSDYPGFRQESIPEIQDLNVRPQYRRRGIGSRLLDAAEQLIGARAPLAGIGFGLYADYGAAQRLYVKRGYVPDGRGAFYGGQPAVAGEKYSLDDDLVLYLVKRLITGG